MFGRIGQYISAAMAGHATLHEMECDAQDGYQFQRTREEAKKHRKAQKKAKADKAARKRNRRK